MPNFVNFNQKGSVAVFFLIIVLLSGLIIIGAYFLKGYLFFPNVKGLNTKPEKIIEEKKVEEKPFWKKYQNTKYNFEITYPAKGIVLGEAENLEGDCGQAIKEQPGLIKFDNFFNIKVFDWQGNIDDYLISIGAKRPYDIEPLQFSSSEEAFKIIGLKKGAEYAVGYPPLVYVRYIIKKSDSLFLIKDLEFPNNLGGCINMRFLDPVKYSQFKNFDFSLEQNFRFTI